eukprot:scaffold551761_cov14-Prasinocladus_malaysianus.AAC.1
MVVARDLCFRSDTLTPGQTSAQCLYRYGTRTARARVFVCGPSDRGRKTTTRCWLSWLNVGSGRPLTTGDNGNVFYKLPEQLESSVRHPRELGPRIGLFLARSCTTSTTTTVLRRSQDRST